MPQIDIISGIYADGTADYRDALPINMMVVPKSTGVSSAYLRNCPGIASFAAGPGICRGTIVWNSALYAVMGTNLVRVDSSGDVTTLGSVWAGGHVSMDYGFDRLAVWAGGRLYYYTDAGVFLQVTDSDLGVVIDGCWIAGYFASTDGTNIIVTELNDPTAVDPLKYGSAEADADPILALKRYQGQLLAFGRNTVETYSNVGGSNFPFQVSQGSQVAVGCIGTHAIAPFAGSFAFVGSARQEAPSVYVLGSGTAQRIATREVELILAGYTEVQLADILVESQATAAHQLLLIHLPDKTLVYDATASQALQRPAWHIRVSGLTDAGQYRMRDLVWCYDKWLGGDPIMSTISQTDEDLTTHYGDATGWRFQTAVGYSKAKSGIVQEIELVGLPGRVSLAEDPTIWTSYSHDGETWSQERPASAGKQGERSKRIAWRRQGVIRQQRMQRFRGQSRIAVAALEATFEPLDSAM